MDDPPTNNEDLLAITATNLTKIYKHGNIKAVDDLSLTIKRGEIYALIGANGSGKTTTINMLTGALRPTSGSISLLGYDLAKYRHRIALSIGVAPQEYSIFTDLTIRENLDFFSLVYEMDTEDYLQRRSELLKVLRLEDRLDDLAKNLSGGMKRRLSLACALIHSPEIVFFDEATVGVDPVLRAFFWDYFRSLANDGTTIILTSHVMDEAERADRIGLMRAGRIIAEGTPDMLRENYNVSNIEELFLKLSNGVEIVD